MTVCQVQRNNALSRVEDVIRSGMDPGDGQNPDFNLADVDENNVLPPITAYYVMKIGALPLIPYFPPGDIDLAKAVQEMAGKHHAVLLANHGPVVAGKNLHEAVYATEELEETARLFLLLQGMKTRFLSSAQVTKLGELFPN